MQLRRVRSGVIELTIIMLSTLMFPLAAFSQKTASGKSTSALGNWEGKLSVSGISLRIRFHIKKNRGGDLTATMDSPDQNANGIPVTKATQDQDNIKLDVQAIRGSYEGTIQPGTDSISGKWMQGGQTVQLNLKRIIGQSDQIDLIRPQEPQPSYPYQVDSVIFENSVDHVKLGGTLTYPSGKGPFPVLVMISGSGAQDRDENFMGHKPFLVIADYLTMHGYAVLRYDDRGVGASEGTMEGATTLDLSNDALAAVDYLSGKKMIDSRHIGLIGHSEGGVQAILLAKRDKKIKALVLLATPSLPGRDISVEQIENISRARGASQASIDKNVEVQKRILVLRDVKLDSMQIISRAKEILRQELPQLSDSQRSEMAVNILDQLMNPWARFYMSYNPRPDLAKLRIPVLALYGSKDLQVSAKTNAAAAQKALAPDDQSKIETIEGLNHLFQEANTGLPSEYSQIQQTFSPKALVIIGKWLDAHLK